MSIGSADIEEALEAERDELAREVASFESSAAMYEAASIVCHCISQFGWGSPQAVNAHGRWRAEYLAWQKPQSAEDA